MNYQKLICWGDSQTFGARSYGCYPLYLGRHLNQHTKYKWQISNLSANKLTARDLWFRISSEICFIQDAHQACILIGANDVANSSAPDLFEEYYRQILATLEIKGFKALYCGEIPPFWPDGHPFFYKAMIDSRVRYNKRISRAVRDFPIARMVHFSNLDEGCYTDPVHFNERGNQRVADAFAKAILTR